MMGPGAAIDQLGSIGLDQLDAVASLSTRRDRKYVVSQDLVAALVGRGALQVLEIEDRRTFRYESVYFDTPDLISYRDAAHKRRRRFKVRTRSYLDSRICSLEVKTRERRGLTEKHRLVYPFERRSELTGDGLDFIEQFDRIAPIAGRLRPTLTTHYSRATLLDSESSSRVTVDTDLEFELPDGSTVSLPDLAVVETKTTGPPCRVDHFLWEAHRRPTKISKYCTGLAALTPGLPANKWNRVLRAHFGWAPQRDTTALDSRVATLSQLEAVAPGPHRVASYLR